jgi:hypothetical protein
VRTIDGPVSTAAASPPPCQMEWRTPEAGTRGGLGLGNLVGLIWVHEYEREAPARLTVHSLRHFSEARGDRRARADVDFDDDGLGGTPSNQVRLKRPRNSGTRAPRGTPSTS